MFLLRIERQAGSLDRVRQRPLGWMFSFMFLVSAVFAVLEALVGFGLCAPDSDFTNCRMVRKGVLWHQTSFCAGCAYGNPTWSYWIESWCPSSLRLKLHGLLYTWHGSRTSQTPSREKSLRISGRLALMSFLWLRLSESCWIMLNLDLILLDMMSVFFRLTVFGTLPSERITIRLLESLRMRRKPKLPPDLKGPGPDSASCYHQGWG